MFTLAAVSLLTLLAGASGCWLRFGAPADGAINAVVLCSPAELLLPDTRAPDDLSLVSMGSEDLSLTLSLSGSRSHCRSRSMRWADGRRGDWASLQVPTEEWICGGGDDNGICAVHLRLEGLPPCTAVKTTMSLRRGGMVTGADLNVSLGGFNQSTVEVRPPGSPSLEPSIGSASASKHTPMVTRGSFGTPSAAGGPSFVRVLAMACARTGSHHSAFRAMARASGDSLFGIHMGDAVYLDEQANSSASFARAFREQLESPSQAELLAHLPLEHVYSDHDFGGNNADGKSSSGDAAVAAHIAFLPAPAAPQGDASDDALAHPCFAWMHNNLTLPLAVPGGPKGQAGNDAILRVLTRRWDQASARCSPHNVGLETALATVTVDPLQEEGEGEGEGEGAVSGSIGLSSSSSSSSGSGTGSVHRSPLGMQRAFSVNRVRFIISDLRRFRSRNHAPDVEDIDTGAGASTGKTMMGRGQLAWFLDEVRRSMETHVMIVWVSEIPWLCRDEKWGWFRRERDSIAAALVAMGAHRRMVILSGDAHMLAVDDGRHSPGGIPVMHAAAIDSPPSIKGGPYSHGASPGRGQFARLEIYDSGVPVPVIEEQMEPLIAGEGLRWGSVAAAAADIVQGKRSPAYEDVPRFYWADTYADIGAINELQARGLPSTDVGGDGETARVVDGSRLILPVPWHVYHGVQHSVHFKSGVCFEYHGWQATRNGLLDGAGAGDVVRGTPMGDTGNGQTAGSWHVGEPPRLDRPSTWGPEKSAARRTVRKVLRFSTCDVLPTKVAGMAGGVKLPASPSSKGIAGLRWAGTFSPPPNLKDRVIGTYREGDAVEGTRWEEEAEGAVTEEYRALDVDKVWSHGTVRGLGPDVPLDAPGGPMDANGIAIWQKGPWSLGQWSTAAMRALSNPEVGSAMVRRALWSQAYGGLRVVQDAAARALVWAYWLQFSIGGDDECVQVLRQCSRARRVRTASSPSKAMSAQDTLGELSDFGCASTRPFAVLDQEARRAAAPSFDPVRLVDALNGYSLWARFGEDMLVAVAAMDGLLATGVGALLALGWAYCCMRRKKPLLPPASSEDRTMQGEDGGGEGEGEGDARANPCALLAVGFMSGTSADGVDAAAVLTDGMFHIDAVGAAAVHFSREQQAVVKAGMWSSPADTTEPESESESGSGSGSGSGSAFDAESPASLAARVVVTEGHCNAVLALRRKLAASGRLHLARMCSAASQLQEQHQGSGGESRSGQEQGFTTTGSDPQGVKGVMDKLSLGGDQFSKDALQVMLLEGTMGLRASRGWDAARAKGKPERSPEDLPEHLLRGCVLGIHGQTLFHSPAARRSVQVIDAQAVLRVAGASTAVHCFRQLDMAKGGQGAPLAPLFHAALAIGAAADGRLDLPVAVLNLGGVANLTYVGVRAAELVVGIGLGAVDDLLGFDCGPGMALLDDAVAGWRQGQGQGLFDGPAFDKDATFAAAGRPDTAAVDAILSGRGSPSKSKSFFTDAPPKSLDRNQLAVAVQQVLPRLPAGASQSEIEDRCATLALLTARAAAQSSVHFPRMPSTWVVVGGGRQHPEVLRMLQEELREGNVAGAKGQESPRVVRAEAMGWDGDMLEAQCFAWLAVRRLRGMPTSLPCTTGVSEPTCGGNIILREDS